MPPPIPVELLPYDAVWPAMAADFAGQLRALGGFIVDVHHIGSTSVPGLSAKPIIDLMPVVTSLSELDRRRPSVMLSASNGMANSDWQDAVIAR